MSKNQNAYCSFSTIHNNHNNNSLDTFIIFFFCFRYLAGVKTLSRDAISNLPKLTKFDVDSTKLQCDCHLFDALYDFIIAGGDVQNAQCMSPSTLSGVNIRKTNVESLKLINESFICSM